MEKKCLKCKRYWDGELKPELGSLCPYWDPHHEKVILPRDYYEGKFCDNFKEARDEKNTDTDNK